ncbi:hypothetical protein [Alkalibaculum bacchi]|jgi:hypothetical protein|uniref:hypothetical protein n=1 Tax=Alkalibaculum bacchi TaxID=645887 RepID=UPI0026EC90C9|nr:hypothetical protein [Alkalibaculum bacchi]
MNDDTEKNISPEKIVEYLGLKNIDELASVLSEVLGKTLKPGKNLIYNSLHYFEINSVSSKYDLYNDLPIITPILYNKMHVGWQCVLGYDKRYYRKYDRDTSLENRPALYKLVIF